MFFSPIVKKFIFIIIPIFIIVFALFSVFNNLKEPELIKTSPPESEFIDYEDQPLMSFAFKNRVYLEEEDIQIQPNIDFSSSFGKGYLGTKKITITGLKLEPSKTYTINIKTENLFGKKKTFALKYKTIDLKESEGSYPLGDFLPEHNSRFKINYNNGVYEITLYAIINSPSQYEQYKVDLKKYKQESLDWIKSKGVDPNSLKIKWLPPEAEKL